MGKLWHSLRMRIPPRREEPVLAVLLESGCLGSSIARPPGTAEDGSEVVVDAYFLAAAGRDEALKRLRRLAGRGDEPSSALEAVEIPDQDWLAAWRAGLRPLAVGRRLLILPGPPGPRGPAGHGQRRLPLRLTPGMAFGSGDHPTTRFCLEQLERHAGRGKDFLDLGTGSGILALAAARLGCRRVVALDNDRQALTEARRNARKNGLRERVEFRSGASPAVARGGAFHLVAANLTGGALLELAGELAGPALAPGGRLILAGILAGREERAVGERYLALGLRRVAGSRRGEWAGFVFQKGQARGRSRPRSRRPAPSPPARGRQRA